MNEEESSILQSLARALRRALKLRDDIDYLPQTPVTLTLLTHVEDTIEGLRKMITQPDNESR